MAIKTAKVVKFFEAGDATVLELISEPIPEPNEYEVRIKVKTIGLNRAEIMFRTNSYLEAPQFPSRLGYEASGILDKLGEGVEAFAVGDEVSSIPAFSMGQYGVYGEYAIVPARALAKNPESFSHQQSTAIWMQYITAYGALVEIGNISQGDNVLITAASSSVGVATIQLAKLLGATVFATTRDESKTDFLLQQGADIVINTSTSSIAEQVMKHTNNTGITLAFDPIGGPIMNELADACATNGIIVEYGALSPETSPYPLFQALAKSLTIRGYTLFELTQNDEKLAEAKAFLSSKFATGQLIPVIDKVFKLEQIITAHQYMESNEQKGKIIIETS